MILNKLFGWDYVEYKDSCTRFIARVKRIPNGELRMFAGGCRGHYSANLNPDGTFHNKGGKWTPLTWENRDE